MKAILYIGHGTRSKKGALGAKAFIERVMMRIDVPIQEMSFLELTEPSIEEGFRRCVERGATEITVVPLFLLAAGHIKQDIPDALIPLLKRYINIEVQVRNPFGVQDQILDCLAELVRNTVKDWTSRDSVLIVGRGSSDPSIHAAFAEISEGIQQRLQSEHVSVCYLAATEPRLQDGLEMITEQSADRVMVIPYLLFPGLLLTEVQQSVLERQKQGQQIMHLGPLSEHSIIEDLLIQKALG